MGVKRLFSFAATWWAAIIGLAWAGPAMAGAVPLAGHTCLAGAQSAEAAYGIAPDALSCDPGGFSLRDRFVRARADVTRAGPLPAGSLLLQTNPVKFESMLVRLEYADGSQKMIDVDSAMTVRNWDANGHFWVPVPRGESALVAVDTVVERPRSAALLRRLELASLDEASGLHHSRTLLYILICGMLLVPIIYDLLFYRILRARFMIWHFGMIVGTLIYVLFDSGLILMLVPDMPALARFAGIFLSISAMIVCTARFTLLIIEEGSIPARVRKIVTGVALANLALAMLIAADVEMLRIHAVRAWLISLLPVVVATTVAMGWALWRGSRAAIFLTFAYSGLLLSGAAQALSSLGLIATGWFIDESVYAALVLLILGTSAGVGDRFLVIKAERDRARLTAMKLGAMANSDGLTGLLNRRAFDQIARLDHGRTLLLADLDRFKAINDTYGHQRGDAVLCHAARIFAAETERLAGRGGEGEAFRLGGEEFAIILPATQRAEMEALAEAIRTAFAEGGAAAERADVPAVTISIGGVLGRGQLMHVAFADADEALYRAKKTGRNRCEFNDVGDEYAI